MHLLRVSISAEAFKKERHFADEDASMEEALVRRQWRKAVAAVDAGNDEGLRRMEMRVREGRWECERWK